MSATIRSLRCATLLVTLAACASLSAHAADSHPVADPALHNPAHSQLSGAAFLMFRDQIQRGMTFKPELIRRFGLDMPDEFPGAAPTDASRVSPLGPAHAAVIALGTDALVNDRSGDTSCPYCLGRPLGQAETSIAADGSTLLTSWNNTKGFCTSGPVQGWAASDDGGATWTDLGDPPSPIAGGRYRGDPQVEVHRATHAFYLLGLYEDPANYLNSGMALMRVTLAGVTPTILNNNQILAGGNDFIDKEWMAVDQASGAIYVTYTRFVGNYTTYVGAQIEMIRSLDGGLTWSAPVVVSEGAGLTDVQGSRPQVGPAGEVYVVWRQYGYPQSPVKIRKSVDGGASFGAIQVVANAYMNDWNGAPGFRRGFGIDLPSIAVDRSGGPNNGRVYVAWSEGVNYSDAPLTFVPQQEAEGNDTFATANVFPVGNTLQGSLWSATDVDLYQFSGTAGQTIFFFTSSSTDPAVGINMRIVCANGDLSTFDNLRIQAYSFGSYPGVVFTLPATGDYYLRLDGAGALTYEVYTTFDTPSAGERARDYRDQFVACSDDGTVWSTPVRLNDDAPLFCGEFPEITVDGVGRVHAFWHDWRDDAACGAESYEYMTSSCDGCASWGANRRVSDERSFWSFNACGSANQGDYQGITSEGSSVYLCWSDSRLGDPDVFTDNPRFASAGACPPNQVGSPGTNVPLAFTLQNTGSVPGNFSWQVLDTGGWLIGAVPGASGSVALGPGGSQIVTATFAVPADCVPNSTLITFTTSDADVPGCSESCSTRLDCDTATPTLASMVGMESGHGFRARRVAAGYAGPHRGPDRAPGGRGRLGRPAAGPGRRRRPHPARGPLVEAGRRYGYRLAFAMNGTTIHGGEAWIEVPRVVAFALSQGARPNPASGNLTVVLSLPARPRHQLEVLDLGGRQLLRQALRRPGYVPGPRA